METKRLENPGAWIVRDSYPKARLGPAIRTGMINDGIWAWRIQDTLLEIISWRHDWIWEKGYYYECILRSSGGRQITRILHANTVILKVSDEPSEHDALLMLAGAGDWLAKGKTWEVSGGTTG